MMKWHIILLFVSIPFVATSQDAYKETKDLIEYQHLLLRADLDTLMDLYVQYLNFSPETKRDVEVCRAFIQDPFGYELDYEEFDTGSFISLDDQIEWHRTTKEERIAPEDYDLILECDPSYPPTYDAFIENDLVILVDGLLDCYDEKYMERHGSLNIVEAGFDVDGVADVDDIALANTPLTKTTQIIDATAQFLVDRVKEELLLAFFERFLTQVDQSPELQSLMPSTYFLLQNNDLFRAPSMGQVWITAFKEDLQSMPVHLDALIRTHPQYSDHRNSDLLQLISIASLVYQNAGPELRYDDFLFEAYELVEGSNSKIAQTLGVVKLVDENLGIIGEVASVPFYKFESLMDLNDQAPLYFSALIYHQERELFHSITLPKLNMTFVMGEELKTKFPIFIQYVYKLYDQFNALKKAHESFFVEGIVDTPFFETEEQRRIYEQEQNKQYRQVVFNFSKRAFEFIDLGIEMAYLGEIEAFYASKYYQKIRPVAQFTMDIFESAEEADYGKMLIHASQILDQITALRIQKLEATIALEKTNVKANKKRKKEIRVLQSVVRNLVFYGGFMADVTLAHSTDEIRYIIEKYAAPVGSYRVKRQASMSVSLSAYPGLYAGWETTNTTFDEVSPVTGITAPIGFSINWGDSFYGMRAKGHSFSLFVPVVDIGAPFSYRWNSDPTEGFPENIRIEQILSPGAHVVWGIGNTPLALMMGTQFTPSLRSINEQSNEIQANAWRIAAALTVDIPVFHFYQSRKQRRIP